MEQQYSTGWGNYFSSGRGLFFSRKIFFSSIQVCLGTGIPAAVPPHLSLKSPTSDSPQVTQVCATLPSPEPKVIAANKKPMLWALKKIVTLTPVGSVCLWKIKTLRFFTSECHMGG